MFLHRLDDALGDVHRPGYLSAFRRNQSSEACGLAIRSIAGAWVATIATVGPVEPRRRASRRLAQLGDRVEMALGLVEDVDGFDVDRPIGRQTARAASLTSSGSRPSRIASTSGRFAAASRSSRALDLLGRAVKG